MNISPNFSREFPTDIWPHPLMARLLPPQPQQRSRGALAESAASSRQGLEPALHEERANLDESNEQRIRRLVAGQIDGWHDTATARIEQFQARFLAKYGMTE